MNKYHRYGRALDLKEKGDIEEDSNKNLRILVRKSDVRDPRARLSSASRSTSIAVNRASSFIGRIAPSFDLYDLTSLPDAVRRASTPRLPGSDAGAEEVAGGKIRGCSWSRFGYD